MCSTSSRNEEAKTRYEMYERIAKADGVDLQADSKVIRDGKKVRVHAYFISRKTPQSSAQVTTYDIRPIDANGSKQEHLYAKGCSNWALM